MKFSAAAKRDSQVERDPGPSDSRFKILDVEKEEVEIEVEDGIEEREREEEEDIFVFFPVARDASKIHENIVKSFSTDSIIVLCTAV